MVQTIDTEKRTRSLFESAMYYQRQFGVVAESTDHGVIFGYRKSAGGFGYIKSTYAHAAASESAMLALPAWQGDLCKRTDNNTTYVLNSNSPSNLSEWISIGASSSYSLPTASASVLGGIRVGANLSIDGSGVLSASVSSMAWASITETPTSLSGYGITDVYTKTASDARYEPIITKSAGYAQWSGATWTFGSIPTASAGTLGLIRVGSGLSIDGSGVLSATATGTIGGSIASTQIAVGSGTNTISGSSLLTYASSIFTAPNVNVASGGRYSEGGTTVFDFGGTGNAVIGKGCGGTAGTYNFVAGYGAMASATSGANYCLAFGYNTLATCQGNFNSFAGYYGGKSITTGVGNAGFGAYNLYALVDGSYNTTFGYANLFQAISSVGCISIGYQNGYNCTGSYNQFYGYGSGGCVTSQSNCLYSGRNSGYQGASGNSVIAMGNQSGYNGIGDYSIVLGENAGFNIMGKTRVIAIGDWAAAACTGNNTVAIGGNGAGQQCGSGCLMLGYMAGNAETGSNLLYIANSSTTTPLIKGDFANAKLWHYGRIFQNTPASAPTDSDLANGQVSFYLDEAGNNLKVRVKYSSGTLKTATVALV